MDIESNIQHGKNLQEAAHNAGDYDELTVYEAGDMVRDAILESTEHSFEKPVHDIEGDKIEVRYHGHLIVLTVEVK